MILFALILGVPLLLLAGWVVWNDSRFDAVLFILGAVMAAGHGALWWLIPLGTPMPLRFLFSPMLLYVLGLIYVGRFFFTPLGGWVRSLYLVVGLAALSPLFVWFVFFPILFML